LASFFARSRFDTQAIKRRGAPLALNQIAKDDRYLISEMACKSYGTNPFQDSDLRKALLDTWRDHKNRGGGGIPLRSLIDGDYLKAKYENKQYEFKFSVDDILDQQIMSEEELTTNYTRIATRFDNARTGATRNTYLYLSMINDLDVYVATSMRTRSDFREMATNTDEIFADPRLTELHLRFFDPTMSAAAGHEDKGLIECLMVKSAKALIYCAGERDSYGKDAEAAMALSLGKPVIFFCDREQKKRFFQEVHPLSRLIHFETGIAVGAMVASSVKDVSELLYRIFENKMQYELDQPRAGYLRLKEKLSGSVVRLQTSDLLLSDIFWNYYQNQPHQEHVDGKS
jgi:hypothetical protein